MVSNTKVDIRRVLMLLISIAINGFAVSVYVKSQMGVSTISSIPLVISEIVPTLSLGMTSIIFQGILILLLIVLVGFKKSFAVSFLLGCFFGIIVDMWNALWNVIPIANLPQVVLFAIAFLSLPFGIAMALVTDLAALPFDIFTKELALKYGKTIKFVKTIFDFTCVFIAIALSLGVLGKIQGVGVGTIISMFFTGTIVQAYYGWFRKLYQ